VDVEGHVAGVEGNDSVGVVSSIVQEMDDGLGGFCSVGFDGYKDAKGDDEGRVDGTNVVQERADYFPESGEVRGGQGSRVVSLRRELSRCTIGGCRPDLRCVLGAFGRLVLELGESLRNVAGRGHVDGTYGVIPIQSETR
jgi:hypothetical protein